MKCRGALARQQHDDRDQQEPRARAELNTMALVEARARCAFNSVAT
jgi:hypothetical protein